MNKRPALSIMAAFMIASGISACNDNGNDAATKSGIRQTGFPGQVSAGGGTSGEVMARSAEVSNTVNATGTPGIPQGSGGNTGGAAMGGTSGPTSGGARDGDETARSQAPGGGVGGTPSIPEGAGGTPSGAAMGGTTSGAAASQTTPSTEAAAPPSVPAQGGGKQ